MSAPLELSSLPEDVIHRFLASLPDYQSLYSAILTSTLFYKAFNNHPLGIISSIAQNMHSRSLPMALRVARAQIQSESAPVDHNTVEPEIQDSDILQITTPEASLLASNFRIVQTLETLFSRRRKDRSSRSNRLDTEESFRFKRGFYRFWLFCVLLDGEGFLEAPELELFNRLPKTASTLFGNLTAQELFEIKGIYDFLWQLTEEGVARHTQTSRYLKDTLWMNYAISCGPSVVLNIFTEMDEPYTSISLRYLFNGETGDPDEERQGIPIRFLLLRSTLDLTFMEINILGPSDKAIVTTVIGIDDSCGRCGIDSNGFSLWNETNWDLLVDVFPFHTLHSYFPGHLARNKHDILKFREHCTDESISYCRLFAEMFPAAHSDTSQRWSAQEWLCRKCITKFLRLNLVRWWGSERKSGRVAGIDPALKSCRSGFECKTQTINPHHAAKLNHICVRAYKLQDLYDLEPTNEVSNM